MARPAPTSRQALNAVPVIAPAAPEAEHFLTCNGCGQAMDLRNLGDVLHHNEPGHARLPAEPATAALLFIPPQLPKLADEPPQGERWSHEIKYDGYRTQLHVSGGVVRAYTRNCHDWSERYGPLVRAAERLSCHSAILDGEVIVQDEAGRCNFAGLRAAIGNQVFASTQIGVPRQSGFAPIDEKSCSGWRASNFAISDRHVDVGATVLTTCAMSVSPL